jgi:hypothetical protein
MRTISNSSIPTTLSLRIQRYQAESMKKQVAEQEWKIERLNSEYNQSTFIENCCTGESWICPYWKGAILDLSSVYGKRWE